MLNFVVGIYFVFLFYALKFDGKNATKLIIIICFFQNFVLMLFSRGIDYFLFSLIVISKEIYVFLYILLRIITLRKISRINLFFFISIAVIFLYFVFYGKGEIRSQLLSFRQLCLPFVFVVFGYLCSLKKESVFELISFYIKVCVFSSLFGFVELYLGNDIWENLGLLRYAELKNNYHFISESDGLYRSFFSHDLDIILGTRVRRMASFCVDPVILGQLLSIGLIFSFFVKDIFYNKFFKFSSEIILLIALIFTFAKGGIIIAIFSFCLLLNLNKKRRVLSYCIFVILMIIFVLFTSHSIKYGLSGFKHLSGLTSSLFSFYDFPFGRGIGAGGNLATNYGNFNESVPGHESYVGSLIVQMGVVGLILNILLLRVFLPKKKYARYLNVIFSTILALFFTSLVNYTAISFTSCFIYLILGGAALRLSRVDFLNCYSRKYVGGGFELSN